MRTQVIDPAADELLDVAVELLEVLGAEEHALRPDDLVIPGHVAIREPSRRMAAPRRA
jgi:hypothetical protein